MSFFSITFNFSIFGRFINLVKRKILNIVGRKQWNLADWSYVDIVRLIFWIMRYQTMNCKRWNISYDEIFPSKKMCRNKCSTRIRQNVRESMLIFENLFWKCSEKIAVKCQSIVNHWINQSNTFRREMSVILILGFCNQSVYFTWNTDKNKMVILLRSHNIILIDVINASRRNSHCRAC